MNDIGEQFWRFQAVKVVRLCKYSNGPKKPLIMAIIRGGLILVLVIQLIKDSLFSSIQFKFITFVAEYSPICFKRYGYTTGLFNRDSFLF